MKRMEKEEKEAESGTSARSGIKARLRCSAHTDILTIVDARQGTEGKRGGEGRDRHGRSGR